MRNILRNSIAPALVVFCLCACSNTKVTHTTHTQKIIHCPIAQEPQLAEYTLSASNKISGRAEATGSQVDGPTLEMVKNEAVYNALKANSADFLVHGIYTATITDNFNSRHITVEVTGFPAKYTKIRPIGGESKRVLEILDTIEMFLSTVPTHDDTLEWLNWMNTSKRPIEKDDGEAKSSTKHHRTVDDDNNTSATQITSSPAQQPIENEQPVKPVAAKNQVSEPVVIDNHETDKEADNDEVKEDGKKYHTVRDEETIHGITQKHKITTDDFRRWNSIPDGIKPGMQVVVYSSDKSANKAQPAKPVEAKQPTAKAQPVPASAGNDTTGYKYHVVEPEETLYHISIVNHVTLQQLRDWNKLSNKGISVGQRLIVGK